MFLRSDIGTTENACSTSVLAAWYDWCEACVICREQIGIIEAKNVLVSEYCHETELKLYEIEESKEYLVNEKNHSGICTLYHNEVNTTFVILQAKIEEVEYTHLIERYLATTTANYFLSFRSSARKGSTVVNQCLVRIK